MQPVPTSAHRRPAIHLPDDLDSCTHVFVLRGGVQPTLTTPYEGPFRVLDRTPEGFRIEFPGRPSDIVALSRLRPAIVAPADDQATSQGAQPDLDDEVPPSPPPPGRRPGLRTRVPETTDRVTRSMSSRETETPRTGPGDQGSTPCGSQDVSGTPPPPDSPRMSPPSSPLRTQPEPALESTLGSEPTGPAVDHDPIDEDPPPHLAAPAVAPPTASSGTARRFTNHQQRHFSKKGGPFPSLALSRPTEGTRDRGGVPPAGTRVLSFSNPQPGDFSHRRRRPDVSTLNALIRSHLS